MLNQAIARKRCASCERWGGKRRPGDEPGTVAIESETATGLCEGGGWAGSERRARSACGHWRLWPPLNAATDDAVRKGKPDAVEDRSVQDMKFDDDAQDKCH